MSGSPPFPSEVAEIACDPPADAAPDAAPDATPDSCQLIDFSGAFAAVDAPAAAGDAAGDVASEDAPPRDADALCAKLLEVSFGDRAFLYPRGTDARIAALEMIRASHRALGRPKRHRLLVCLGADAPVASTTLLDGIRADADLEIVATDDAEAIAALVTPKTAGFLVAPVRLEGALEVVGGGLLAGLRQIADDYGLALVFDETFSGLGRSGMAWAHEWRGVTPDVMISGAGLAGDLPLAAVVTTAKVAKGAGGARPAPDPAALAAGHRVMDGLLSPGFEARVQSRAWALEDRLSLLMYRHREVFAGLCGHGLLQGLVCAGPVEAEGLRARLADRGVLVRALGPVLAFFPPLDVAEADLDAAVAALEACVAGEGAA